MSWFEVDRDGLRQLLEDRDKSFILRELVQNAWDEPGVTRCDVTLEAIPGKRVGRLVVEDDAPEVVPDWHTGGEVSLSAKVCQNCAKTRRKSSWDDGNGQ